LFRVGLEELVMVAAKRVSHLPILRTGVAGVVRMHGVSESTVWRAIRSGKLPVSRVGRRVLIKIEDAERYFSGAAPASSAERTAKRRGK